MPNEVLEWLKTLGPFLIAVVVAYATWRFQQWQVCLEKEKLHHQLYDRRFVIYKSFQKLLIALVDKPDDEIKAAFQEATIAGLDALFLLPDPEVQAYLKELQEQVLDEVIRNIMFFEGVKPHPELMNEPAHNKEHLQRASQLGAAKLTIHTRHIPELSQQFLKFLELTDFNKISHKKNRPKLFHKG